MTKKNTRIKKNIASPIINGSIKGDFNNQYHTGSGNNIGKDNSHKSPKFDKLAEEIKALIEKKEQIYNPNTEQGQKIIIEKSIEEIENNYNLAQRISSALGKGFIGYLQALLISPVASAFLAALEDWQQKTNTTRQTKKNTELTLSQRQEFLKLPVEERRRILERQSEQIQQHYQEDTQWQEWLEGDIIDY